MTLEDINAAILAYQQSQIDIDAQVIVVDTARAAIDLATTDGQAAIDAASAAQADAVAAAQLTFDSQFAALNALVSDQNAALNAIQAAVLAYVPPP